MCAHKGKILRQFNFRDITTRVLPLPLMWDIYNTMGGFYANYMAGVKSSHYDCTQSQGADNVLSQSDTETKGLRQAIGEDIADRLLQGCNVH